jgi:hypothetical protein
VSPWVPGFGVSRAAAIADLGGNRGKLCRWGDRGGGWGAMAAGSAALVGRSPSGLPHIEGTLYPAPASIEHMGEIECIDGVMPQRVAPMKN